MNKRRLSTLFVFLSVLAFGSVPVSGPQAYEMSEPGRIIGIVLDHQGRPVVGARVYAKERGQARDEQTRYFSTDAEGKFEIYGLRTGAFDVYVIPDSSSILPRTSVAVRLTNDSPAQRVTIRLRAQRRQVFEAPHGSKARVGPYS